MRVLVVGAGAVGSWLGGHLALGGAEVTLVARGPHGAALAATGLSLQRGESAVTVRPAVTADVAAAARSGPYDWALVCVKSYHTDSVARELAASGAPGCVASFQNGIGNEAVLAALLPSAQVVAATLTSAVWVDPPGTVNGGGKGGVGLAADVVADELAAGLARGGITVRRYRDSVAMKWSKLLLNMLGSATSALLAWSPARVFADRQLFHVELRAWREALAVVRALGQRPVALPGYRVDLFAALAATLPEAVIYRTIAGRLASGRGERLPGPAADLAAGRGETEIRVLHGAVAEAGGHLGVPVPTCRRLADLVADTAAGRIPRGTFVDRPAALLAALAGGDVTR